MRVIILILLAVFQISCGGAFLPPPRPNNRPICIQDLQKRWLNCDCWQQTGDFTWKGWKWRSCPTIACIEIPRVRNQDICEEVAPREVNCWNCIEWSEKNECCLDWEFESKN